MSLTLSEDHKPAMPNHRAMSRAEYPPQPQRADEGGGLFGAMASIVNTFVDAGKKKPPTAKMAEIPSTSPDPFHL